MQKDMFTVNSGREMGFWGRHVKLAHVGLALDLNLQASALCVYGMISPPYIRPDEMELAPIGGRESDEVALKLLSHEGVSNGRLQFHWFHTCYQLVGRDPKRGLQVFSDRGTASRGTEVYAKIIKCNQPHNQGCMERIFYPS